MPDFLGSLVELFNILEQAKLGWLANIALVLVTIVSVVYFLALTLFSPPVIKLGKLAVSLKPKLAEAMSSPYDDKFVESKIFLTISLSIYYMYMIFMIFYAIIFAGLASGVLLDEKLPMSKSLLAYFCAFVMFVFARFFKCQGDKELFKLRNRRNK